MSDHRARPHRADWPVAAWLLAAGLAAPSPAHAQAPPRVASAVRPESHAAVAASSSDARSLLLALKILEREVLMSGAEEELREGGGAARLGRDRARRPRDLDEAGGPQGSRGDSRAAMRPAGPGRLASAIPANHPMNDRAGEHAYASAQAEVSIAARGRHVVAMWNDGEYAPAGGDGVSYGWSSDGGATWRDGGTLPHGGGVGLWTSDPVVTVDEKSGRFYLAALLITLNARNGLGVVAGTFADTGLVLEPPVIVRTVRDTLPDKPWIAVDSLTGHLYVSYTAFFLRDGMLSDQIEFQRSTDGNRSWTPPLTLSPPAEVGLVHGARPAVGPDGEVHVVWKTVDTSWAAGGRDWIRARTSRDGGRSFGPLRSVTDLFTNFGSGAPGFNRPYGFVFPSIAVDRSAGPLRGRVYVAWNEGVSFYGDTLGRGASVVEQEPNNVPVSATAALVGQTLRGRIENSSDGDFYRFSGDRGQTVVFFLDSLSAGLDVAMRLFCGDGITRLAYSAQAEGRPRLLVFTLPEAGDYFLRLAPNSTGSGGYRILSAFHRPAAERARDHRDVFVAASDDGFRWSRPARVNDDAPWLDDWLPEVGVSGEGKVVTAWYDWRDAADGLCAGGSGTYLAVSSDGGRVWGASRPVADAVTPWSEVGSNQLPNQGDYIGLFVSADTAHVAWADGRNGDPDAYSASVGLEDVPRPAQRGPALALDGPWPNPTSTALTLRVSLASPRPAAVSLLDSFGRRCRRAVLTPRAAGWQWVDLGTCDGLAPGLYFIQVSQDGRSASRKVVILR
jgi:hypothetical protein